MLNVPDPAPLSRSERPILMSLRAEVVAIVAELMLIGADKGSGARVILICREVRVP